MVMFGILLRGLQRLLRRKPASLPEETLQQTAIRIYTRSSTARKNQLMTDARKWKDEMTQQGKTIKEDGYLLVLRFLQHRLVTEEFVKLK